MHFVLQSFTLLIPTSCKLKFIYILFSFCFYCCLCFSFVCTENKSASLKVVSHLHIACPYTKETLLKIIREVRGERTVEMTIMYI